MRTEKKQLLDLFYRVVACVCDENQDTKTIEKTNALTDKLIDLLPFKSQEEKEHYLDLLMGYKFIEDLEQETIRIINNLY